MTLNCYATFKETLTSGLRDDIGKLVNFYASSRKPENMHFNGLFLSKAYKI